MVVGLFIKMYFILVLCPVLLAAGVQTLTIDSQLGTSIEDCFERISIGEQIPLDAIYRNVTELTTRECEQICKQDKQCQAYDYGVGAKGNATCELSNLSEKEIKEKNVLSRHPDYDVYVRRFQCEQSPPTPIQPQFDDPLLDNPEGPNRPQRPERPERPEEPTRPERPDRPSHRPVFRPNGDKFSDDYLVSGDLRPYEPGRPSPYRPDDYSNNKPHEDNPPSYGDLKPQDIPYRPEKPTQNQSYNQRPADELNFQGYGLAGKPQDSYNLEKPEYQYITRPNRKPYQIEEGYRPDPYGQNEPAAIGGYSVNGGRPGPVGPPDRPYRPSRPYGRPDERPGYYSHYASAYGQNSQTENSIYVEIHDPPRPYKPVEKPYGLQGYGTYSSQNSYANNAQYTQGTITEIGGYDQNRPIDSHRPDPISQRPERPYGGDSEGSAGYGPQKPSKPIKPYVESQSSYSSTQGYGQSSSSQGYHGESHGSYGQSSQGQGYDRPSSGSQGSYNSGQSSGGYGIHDNYGSSGSDRPYGSGGGNKPYERPGYGQKPQKPDRPGYGSQAGYGSLEYQSQQSYSSSQSNQESYNSQSYGISRPTQSGYGQKPERPYDKPDPYPSSQGYGGSQGSYGNSQEAYGSSQGSYGESQSSYGGSQGSYGLSHTSGGSQGSYGSQSPSIGSQDSYGGSRPSYGETQGSYGSKPPSGGSQGSYGGRPSSSGGSQGSYGGSKPSYGSSQGFYGGSQGSYGSSQSSSSLSSYGGGQSSYGQGSYGGSQSSSSDSYGGSRPAYGGSQGSYGSVNEGSYGSNQGSYGSTQGSYGSSQGSSYGGSQGSFGSSQGSYGDSQGSQGGSQGPYGGSQGSYGGSQSNYGSSQGSYGSGQASYVSTESSYGSSQSSVSTQESYGGSQGSYGTSQGSYGSNQDSYAGRPNDKFSSKPSYGSNKKPGYNERPDSNYGQKPGYGERPDTGYGQKPSYNGRPDTGYGQKPSYNERPSSGYGQKPDYNERPDNYGQKPGHSDRPDGSYGANEDKPSYGRPGNSSEYPGVKPVYEYELEKPVDTPSYIVKPGGEVVTSRPVVIGDYGERVNDPARKGTYKACFRRVLAGKRALRSHVRKVVPCERVEDCRQECATEIRFPCESFNYRLDRTFRGKGLCELMTKPIEAFDVRRDFVEDKDYDFYERDRNSLEPNCPETLRGPGLLHSGFLSSKPGKAGEGDGWRDRSDWHNREYGYNRYESERRGSSNRRYEDRFFVPYQIGVGRTNDDQQNWGQYGGSYGNYNSYYKDSEDYHKSINHWRLTNQVDRPYGVRPLENTIDHPIGRPMDSFDYQNLVKSPWSQRYGYGNWKRGRWNSSGGSWNDVEYREYEKNKFEGRSEESDGKDCSSRRRPGMSLSSGAIRRSLLAENVVECEAACFGEREFKCVSYSFRYSQSRGSDNCFLSERPYRGLELSADSGSDVYAMPQDHGCVTINYRPWVESECFWHVRSGAAVSGAAARAALTVAGLGACEAECIRATGFFCRGFSFRFDSPTIGDELENCILTSSPPTSLEAGHGLRPTSGHELYARGNYGRGCEPALYDDTQHKESQCYLQYDSAAKLSGAAVRGAARVRDEQACGAACTHAPFRCLSFSYNNNAAPGVDNCFLSEIRLFDLQRGVDYVHSLDDWLFAFDLFNGQCWRKVYGKGDYEEPSPELPHPIAISGPDETFPSGPSGPGYLPDHPDHPYIPASGPPSGPDFKPYSPGPEPPIFKPGYPGPSRPGYRPYPVEPSGPGPKPYEPSSPGYKPGYPPGFKPSYPPEPSGPGFKPGYPAPSGPSGPTGPTAPVGPIGPSGPLGTSGPGYGPGDFKPAYRPSADFGNRPGYKPGYPEKPGFMDRPTVGSGRPGPQKPIYHGDREENDIAVSWRHYTVSGFPCRAGTSCAQNHVAGHWACEPEGGEIGSWDYCCAPTHRCGYSEGFHKPWCYVGPTEDQWRPCSEKYYPYHQHNVPHPSSQGHRGERPSQPQPWTDRPGYNQERPQGPYLSDADRKYWDELYKNGPKAYYDKYGNPLPGYTRVPTEDRPYIKYSHNPPRPGSGHWVPVSSGDSDYRSSVPGGLGTPRYWPVAYLHKGPPPNMTYFRYNETTTTTEKPTPLSRELPDSISIDTQSHSDKPKNIDKHRDEKKRNISDFDRDIFKTDEKTAVKPITTEVPIVENNDTKLNFSEIATPQGFKFTKVDTIDGIDDKLDDFTTIEVLDLEDAKKEETKADLKTLEAEEKQIEEIGRLLASRRGGKLVIEKRSQKNLEAKNIAVDEDLVDFNFGNRFPTTERRGIIQKVSKDEIEREKNTDKSLELSETTFVRPPRVLSTTDNIRKAIVNGKVFYDATIREQRDIFSNTTRKAKSLRPLEDRAPTVIPQAAFGKKKVIRARNANPVRRVRRVYRKKYNPEDVRRRLLERERSKKNSTDSSRKI